MTAEQGYLLFETVRNVESSNCSVLSVGPCEGLVNAAFLQISLGLLVLSSV